MNKPFDPAVVVGVTAPRKQVPMPDDATIRALEAYFAKLEKDPGDEPPWLVEDLFPPDPAP